jgi:GNAT superfamily N-acetyltransferase
MIAIRPAVAADVAALVAVDSYAADHPARVDEIASWIAAGQCFVAEREGEAAGYAVLTESFLHQPFVEMLMVSETARRRGVGRALLAHCSTQVEAKLWTSTNASNAAMRALLGRAGFVESGIIHNLDPGDPELIFVLLR